jgi:hypothetical protein
MSELYNVEYNILYTQEVWEFIYNASIEYIIITYSCVIYNHIMKI